MFEVLELARWQFAITTVYHFLFVPLTLGLSIVTAIIQTKYYRTNDEKYKKMTKFWGKLFLINFSIGVATGLVQEFQFGMNWSEYARFMGDIFGAPLAIEALAAFFIESTFIGIWIFGWDRINKGLHLISIWLVAFASNLSAFWILVANSFMQNPVGYAINNGRAEMQDFLSIVTNPYFIHQYPHVVTGGLATAGFFVMGISAYHLARKQNTEMMKSSFKVGAVVALIASLAVAGVGHATAQYLYREKPMKLAAMEAHWETDSNVGLSLFASIDTEKQKNNASFGIPSLLSFMATNDPSAEVKGLVDLQKDHEALYGEGDYIPDVKTMYWSFRAMVASGSLMILLSLYALVLVLRKKLDGKLAKLLFKILPIAILLPFIANSFGWILTETGRQPWLVYGLQKTADGVSTVVPYSSVMITLVGFTLLYFILAVVEVGLMFKYSKQVEPTEPKTGEEGSLWV